MTGIFVFQVLQHNGLIFMEPTWLQKLYIMLCFAKVDGPNLHAIEIIASNYYWAKVDSVDAVNRCHLKPYSSAFTASWVLKAMESSWLVSSIVFGCPACCVIPKKNG